MREPGRQSARENELLVSQHRGLRELHVVICARIGHREGSEIGQALGKLDVGL